MRGFSIALLAASALWGADDAAGIVRRAAAKDRANEQLARAYTFIERQHNREFDGSGNPKKNEIRTFDVTLAEGSPYRRLIARNDQPLSPDEERQEQEKLERNIRERQAETPEQRAKRLVDWEKRRRREREFLEDLPKAFNFTLRGEDRMDGRELWVIDAVPRPGYRPRSLATRFLTGMKGTLWIDKADYAFVKTEAEVTDTVSVGAFLLRIHKGTRFLLEQTRVNNEVWLPRHFRLKGSARVALVKKIDADLDFTYRDFRKFSADSHVVSFEDHLSGTQP